VTFNYQSFKIINYFIDAMFTLDLILNFRTTIIGDSNIEITNGRQIAIHYLKSWRFIIDILSCIPYDSMMDSENNSSSKFRIFAILKLIRLFRFTKVISFLNATEDVKLSLKLLKLLFYLVIYLHLQGCAWFLYTKWDRTWLPLPDIIKHHNDFYDHPVYHTYCFSVWHSVSIMAGEDMFPATAQQAIVTSILLLSSSFIEGSILGTINVVIESLNRKSTKL
jgi:Ion transport protein